MSGSAINNMTQPAVSASGLVDTLLIEKFTGEVNKRYLEGENLLGMFRKQSVTGTNMISNKYMSGGKLQSLTPGQEPEATDRQFDKNALIVDTIIMARDYVHDLHRLQNDFEVLQALASDQVDMIKVFEDQFTIQQLLAGALTGGAYDWQDKSAGAITGGTRRLKDHGVAIKTEISDAQAGDPYKLVSALEITLMGMIIQRVPMNGMKILMPVEDFSLLADYGYIATTEGGSNQSEMGMMGTSAMRGRLKSFNVDVMGSVEFTQSIINPNFGDAHSLLSNEDNAFRYDFTDEMKQARAVIFGPKALMVGETIALQTDIFYDKKTKGTFADAWISEGATSDRYDHLGVVVGGGSVNAGVDVKAKAKAKATRTI